MIGEHPKTAPASIEAFDIVIVDHAEEGYRHFGQAVIRPTLEGRVLVRLVPGDPTTAVWLPEDALRPTTARPRWRHYARIDGRRDRPFPVDMLRHDFAGPANFLLVPEVGPGGVQRYLPSPRPPAGGTLGDAAPDAGLLIGAATEGKEPGWCVDRWLSFGWSIERVATLPIEE